MADVLGQGWNGKQPGVLPGRFPDSLRSGRAYQAVVSPDSKPSEKISDALTTWNRSGR